MKKKKIVRNTFMQINALLNHIQIQISIDTEY